MKEFKGTPGPWFLGGVENEKQSVNASAYFIALVDEGACRNVNARLIAAAPELLSALQEVIKSLEITLRVGYEKITELGGDCDSPEVMIKGHSEIARAKQVIAKALGESQ